MPNDNHEVYSGKNICTYTDYITVSNPFTNEQIDACILSAGTPNGFENRGEISNAQNVEQVAANSLSPWYSRSGMYLEYDTQECNQMDPASWQSYYHILYGYWDSGNVGLCTNMDIKKYRNLVTITPASQTYYGHTFDYYKLSIKTQYGTTGDWNDSVLKPILVIPTETLRLGYDIGLDSYKHWAVAEMSAFGFRHTITSYNTYISFNDGTGGLAPVTCPCSIGADFVWTPTSETDSKWFSDDHYNYGWYDINYGGGGGFHAYSFQEYNNIDDLLMIVAICGLKFEYNGTTYKPIVTGGIVTGYTDDMTEESEWDEWENIGDHTIPVDPTPVPPTPPSDGDDMDVMNTGATGSSGGFTHFYIMSPQDLIDLLSDFYTHADSGETLSNNLVCSYILGIPSSSWAATEEVPVAIHNSAQGTPFVSVDKYSHVTATNNMLVTGTFDVPRMTNTFYDFSPYSTYEVFIPCCGWVRLPDTVAGRTIKVYLYLDIASCCVKGQVMISGAGVCAVVNGALGSPIPIAVIESGILRGNNIQAGMGMIGGAIQTGVSAGNGNSMGIGLGAERILSGLVNCTVAGNTNYTEQKGGTGDITQFAMGHQCYMKITHPVIDPVVNEYIFGHTVGYLCNTIGQLSDFHGFTMCSNPHINISASDREREEIKQFLEQGVILPEGE